MKKFIKLLCVICVLILVLTGCGNRTNEETSASSVQSQVETINISYVTAPLNVPSIIEKNENLFEKEFGDIKINFPEITQGSKMTEAIATEDLDFCNALGGTSAIIGKVNGVDLKIVGIYSRAPKGFTIMTNDKNIQSVKDLKGKKIAGPKGTILHQLLIAAGNEANVSINDMKFIQMDIGNGVSSMMSGNVDAALVAGPAVIKAQEGGAHILRNGEGLLDATIVIGVRAGFLKEHPDLVEKYMHVHENALKIMEENEEKMVKMVAEETGVSVEEVKAMYPWYDFNPMITEKDIKELEKTQDFLFDNDMIPEKIELKTLLIEK
ncbi:ABC transporter substrate-binding protein [Marinisporobacter balticus]|uniref:Sulfonate transport system substrate-binding protein n=1 Tax=Marinisporobacter balticus TaxID=2018667 RepID=A0A4R2KWS6_9FIRM|nr:NrtA/SsuA/CpmA family ABC transporter substrate-binding protein [Marinisporobacter balticus]TCO77492.1 sulfonate transport system substrate-binding protein [Marinisporobacter balticus]